MNNPKRLEVIREKIKISKMLSDHEKSDWLNLLDLMNDKQFGELEEILEAEFPTIKAEELAATQNPDRNLSPVAVPPISDPAAVAAMATTPSQQKMPPLSHLANFPTGITPRPAPVQAPPAPTPSPIAPAKSAIVRPEAPLAPATAEVSPAIEEPIVPVAKSGYATPPAQTSEAVKKPLFSLGDVEQLRTITLETIRNFDLQSIVDIIRDAIIENGYFHVLELIEESPLYVDYIDSGKKLLQGQQSSFTQEEFEFITDLLTHMRFNRV